MTTPVQALLRGFDLAPATGVAALPGGAAAGAVQPSRDAGAGWQARQGFRIGGLHLMIRYEDGSELTELPPVHWLPNAPHWLLGVANLHGMLLPVFDLARWLDIERDGAAKPMLLVLGHGGNAAGVVIDGLPERLRWTQAPQADLATAPQTLAGALHGAVLLGDQLRFDVDCDALLQLLERSLESVQ